MVRTVQDVVRTSGQVCPGSEPLTCRLLLADEHGDGQSSRKREIRLSASPHACVWNQATARWLLAFGMETRSTIAKKSHPCLDCARDPTESVRFPPSWPRVLLSSVRSDTLLDALTNERVSSLMLMAACRPEQRFIEVSQTLNVALNVQLFLD